MKKLTLFLVAMTMSLFSFAAQPKRIYAYDLSSALVDKVYTFSFTANETPTSGKIIFYDATSSELVGEIALTNPVLGKNEVEIAEYSLPGNDGQQLNWAVELSAAEVTAFEAVYTGTKKYGRGHATIDNSPESDYFGRVYVTDRRTSNSKSGLYVYTPDLQLINNTVYALGRDESGYARPAVAADGTLFLADYTDARRSGIWVVNPSDLTTCTQFYNGTRASSGLFTNAAGKEIGSSTSGVGVYGSGTNTVLYTMMEDGTNASSAVCYHIGQLDGSILKTWSDVPTWICTAYASINPSTNNAFAATEKGVWVSQNDGTTGRKELAFIDNTGVLQYSIDNGKCEGAGLAVNSDNSKLFICGSTSILEYDVVWDGKTPALALKQTHTISDRYVSTLSFDYAGNLLACTGASYSGTDSDVMRLIQYTIPTDKNTCEVPAKKAYIVTKKEADVTLYTVTTQVVGEGSITGNLGTYEAGASAELTAVANEHYDFVNWTGDVNSTENPLTITVDGNKNITANFAKKQYTLTVQANDPTKGSVALDPAGGIYEYETEVTLTATANEGYEFVNWSNGSTDNPLTMTVTGEETITANFRAILASSITLNAHPVRDYSTSIVGTMKRAVQNGENTIVLTHEDNGTPHIYNIAHATKEVTEISQVGVVAVDPDNAGDFLAISDIALTDDGKLVACNYMMCQITANEVDAGYKRGTSRFYIWDNLGGDPRLWISSQLTGNYYRASMGYTMALKGTSMNAEVTISAFNKTNTNTRYSHLYVVDGAYSDANYKYSRDNAALHPSTLGPNTYELNASPLAAGQWILDGELTSPIEFVEKDAIAIDTYTALNTNVLGKKYNGASYLFHKDHHLMIAPYAADDKLAGVKVLGISDGFDAATLVTTATDLTTAIDATTAAATAYVDGDGDLTIYLIADGKVYPFSEKAYTAQTFTITAIAGEGGTVEGSGPYEENTTATLTATPAEHYDFLNWTYGSETSTDNPLTITVNSDMTITANFQEHTKYTITAVANDENMGTVTGGGTYYVGETITLKATAKSSYVFAGWTDGEKNATRTVEVSGDATYTANFQAIAPRAWAYDLKVTENGDKYEFTFKATAAGSATLLFADIDGNPVAPTSHDVDPVAVGVNTVLVAKAAFTENKDVYWSVKMDGEAIPAISEITDQSRGIYDFYNMMGVVVDNDPNSDYFGKIYIQQSYEYPGSGNTAERNKTQKAGIFIYDQGLNELNNPANTGIQPQLPYALGGDRQTFKRIAINPANGNIAFCNNKTDNGGAYSVSRADLTSEAVNLTKDIADIKNVNALCYDKDGNLYVVANVVTNYTNGDIYKIADDGTYTKLTPLRPDGKKIWVNEEIAVVSDGRGGIWVAQTRDNIDQYSALFHVNFDESKVDFVLEKGQGYSDWFETKNRRGAIAYDTQRNILAVHGPSAASLFSVEYDAEGVPSITKFLQTPNIGNSNIDGLAFDYAGDLYLVSSGTEKFYKYTIPTDENICTVPAPASQKLVLGTQCEVTVTVNDPAMGSVEGAGQYEKGATVELEATANEHYQFVNWTKGEEVLSAENPYSFTAEEDVTITANFAELPKYTITVQANNEAMGSVDGGGTVHVGESVEIKAIPNAGYAFVKWDDDNTFATRTVEVVGDKTYTAIFQAMIPRAWAYDLRMVEDGDNYKFTFKATSAGDATLLFTNKAGTPIAPTYSIGNVEAGEKSVTIAKSEFGGTEDIYWSVQMDGAAIENMIEITDASGNYDFFMPQDVKVDNSPNSMYFGQVYVAAAVEGASRGGTQKRGIFVYDQKLAELNTPNVGYLPANVTLTDATRHAIHRLAVNPINGYVAFAYNVSGSSAVWSMNPADMSGNAVNLIDNSITAANSICFDEEGALYVMDNANAGSIGGQIYKEDENGKLNLFAAHNKDFQWANADNALAPDGRGGLWIAQNRWALDTYPVIIHVNAEGIVDYAVTSASSDELKAMFPFDNATSVSYRGHCAYYVEDDILAFGGYNQVALFKVTYDGAGKPTITEKMMTTPQIGVNIDGVAFDYAGDLYVASATAERMYKFVVPTTDNTCTVPAPESQVIQKETRYTVTVVANPAEGGIVSVSDGGNAVEGATLEVTATANTGYRFVNWTKDAEEVSTSASFEYTVPAGDVTLTANFAPLPEITYELNGGVWNKYGWTSKKDMYNALLDDWRAYSGSTRTNVSYEEQLGIGNSSKGIPTTIYYTEDRLALQALFTDATYAPEWGWLATYVDAVAVAQSKATQPTTAAGNLVYALGNFFGEDNVHATDWMGAVDFTGEEAHITAFAPYWGQTFPLPTQPTEEVVLNAPYREGYEFDGWYTTSDFSGSVVTTVDENTDGTLYAKWIESVIIVTIDDGPNNTAALTPHDGETVTVKVNRSFGENKILTLTLPFDMSATQISTYFGNATIYEFYKVVDAGEELHLQFYRTTSIGAGKPYILQTTSGYDAVDGFTIEGVTITTALSPVEIDGITMMPVLDGDGQLNQSTEYYLSNNALYCAGNYPQSLLGLRAYFTSPSPTPIRARVVFGENEATSIPMVTTPETKAQKIIQDGRLIIIRGEHQYNAQGQIIE